MVDVSVLHSRKRKPSARRLLDILESHQRGLLLALVLALIGAASLAVWFFSLYQQASQLLIVQDAANTVVGNMQGIVLAQQAEDVTPYDPFLAYALALQAAAVDSTSPQVYRTLAALAYEGGAVRQYDTSSVDAVEFTPDGRNALVGTSGGLALWDLVSGELIRTYGDRQQIRCLSLSPDGQTVLANTEHTITLWNVATGEALRTYDPHEGGIIRCVKFSPDGQSAVSIAVGSRLVLWSVATGEILHVFEDAGLVARFAFSGDGHILYSATESGGITEWDMATGDVLEDDLIRDHALFVTDIAPSPDGMDIITASLDGSLVLWKRYSMAQHIPLVGHPSPVTDVAFSPDGRIAASVSRDGTLIVWNVETGQAIRHFRRYSLWNSPLAFSPDGRTLLSGGDQLTLWDTTSPQILQSYTLSNPYGVFELAFSPNGQTFVAQGDFGVFFLVDTATGAVLQTYDDVNIGGTNIAFNSQGDLALFGIGNSLIAWNLTTGTVTHLETDSSFPFGTVVALSVDGHVALSVADRQLTQWDITRGEALRTIDFDRDLSVVALSPDGTTAVLGASDGTLMLWDVGTGQTIREFTGAVPYLRSIVFSADGQTVLTTGFASTILWDVATGQPRLILPQLTTGTESGDFSPDGRTVLSVNYFGGITLWDAATGETLHTFDAHNGAAYDIDVSPDGHSAISSSSDGIVTRWRIDTLQELIDWLVANREVPQLTCQQHFAYQIEPYCDWNNTLPTSTPYPTPSPTP